MYFLIWLLSIVISLGLLGCWILVEVKMFQAGMIWQGIVGIVTCGIFALIWGWVKVDELGLRKVMPIYTALFVASLALNFVTRSMAPSVVVGQPVTVVR